jgi:predicted DNA-binding transcriptional regulator AlpA
MKRPHEPNELENRLSLTAKECSQLTGIAPSTFLCWAHYDKDLAPGEERMGPKSFMLRGRRMWLRSDLMEWFNDQVEKTSC